MALNAMIIAGMILATAVVGMFVAIDEKRQERRERKITEEIWGRM